jgi:hypothetical protein
MTNCRRILFIVLIIFTAEIFGCAVKVKSNAINSDLNIFLDANNEIGRNVVLRGFLKYESKNRNLFPSAELVSQKYCLPILIRRNQLKLIGLAEKYNGSNVEINGKIIVIASPGNISISTCKSVGVAIDQIRINVE